MRITRRHFLTSASALAVSLTARDSLCESGPALLRFEFSEPHMGTMFKTVLYAPDQAAAAAASRAAFDRIAALDHIMSDYNQSSELMQLCRAAGGPAVNVSEDLYRVMSAAQELSARSHGAFDITVGPVVQLWRRARRRHQLPEPERLAAALERVGYQNVRLDSKRRTAQLLKPGMLLDLGGIAKGDAADQALIVLKRRQITRALVAAAGDIVVGDPPPGPIDWRIGIEAFESPASPPSEFIGLHNGAVSTSGDSEQHVEIGGVRYSHIVDPKTGMALTGRRSVTVTAPHDITADCYATAICVLGHERGLRLIAGTPGTAALIMEEESSRLHQYQSRGFPELKPTSASADAQ
ncbi:MAG TPA: FAD:protein FMN transferase [Terriglobia bacterium]|nr:FAD:protein FMN transferase [Terriglobia bacterium]